MMSYMEEEFLKLITLKHVKGSIDSQGENNIYMEMSSKDKMFIITNLKTFFKNNLFKTSLAMIMAKYLSTIFSKILFRFVDDNDQSVRIAADECINLIIRLNSFQYSSYLIYNLFIEIKQFHSTRSFRAALQKFASICHMIKYSKRISYINNLIPAIKKALLSTDESVLASIGKYLPNIAQILFSSASDNDIDNGIISHLIHNLTTSIDVANQRYIAEIIAECCFFMKNVTLHFQKLLRYFLTLNMQNDASIRSFLFISKYLCVNYLQKSEFKLDFDELNIVVSRIIIICENDYSSSLKNLALDCLYHILQIRDSLCLNTFLNMIEPNRNISKVDIISWEGLYSSKKSLEESNHETEEDLGSDISDLGSENMSITSGFGTDMEPIASYQSYDSSGVSINLNEDQNEVLSNYKSENLIDFEDNSTSEAYLSKDELEEEEELKDQECIKSARKLTCFEICKDSPISYLVKLFFIEFLNDGLTNQEMIAFYNCADRKSRVNIKVLSINCIGLLMKLDATILTTSFKYEDSEFTLDSILDPLSYFVKDDDSQLSGSALQCIGVAAALIIERKFSQVDHWLYIDYIQDILIKPTSGQHVKFVLSAIKQFIGQLSNHEIIDHRTIHLIDSICSYAQHNYKLVRKEVLSVLKSINFHEILFYQLYNSSSQQNKMCFNREKLLTEKVVDLVLEMIVDPDQDIRDEACETCLGLIENGGLDKSDRFQCGCRSDLRDKYKSFESLSDGTSLIPNIDGQINVTLSQIRQHRYQNQFCTMHCAISSANRLCHYTINLLIQTSSAASREIKFPLNRITGYVQLLLKLYQHYSNLSNSNTNGNLCSHLICLMLQSNLTLQDPILHSNLIQLTSILLLRNSLIKLHNQTFTTHDNSAPVPLKLNPASTQVANIQALMKHSCQLMNIFWHLIQFINPIMPAHKTVIPSLTQSSNNHSSIISPNKKKSTSSTQNSPSDSSLSIDSRPPRTKAALGFFFNNPQYLALHSSLNIAYNSYIISPENSSVDKLMLLLSHTIDCTASLLELLTFTEISNCAEELLAYCAVFYPVLPCNTIHLTIKLLAALFGTNITLQYDGFIQQALVSTVLSVAKPTNNKYPDLAEYSVDNWKGFATKYGVRIQQSLLNAATNLSSGSSSLISGSSSEGNLSNPASPYDDKLCELYYWLRCTGKRREPGILKQIAQTPSSVPTGSPNNNSNRPNLTHYIGLFEKTVFQCMRQYLISSTSVQTGIIKLLCQLIYLKVNYCQLDSEQKFMNIIISQVENITSFNDNSEDVGSLVVEIIEFLILLTYEKSGAGIKKDKPILNLTQITHIMETLIANGLSIDTVVIPCMWKVITDLYVHRTVWLANPIHFNLLPNVDAVKETKLLRESVLELILRKLIGYSDTMEMLALIIEQSAREDEEKWKLVSQKIWSYILPNIIDDSWFINIKMHHLDSFERMICLLDIKTTAGKSSTDYSLVDLALSYRSLTLDINQDLFTSTESSIVIESIELFLRQITRCSQFLKFIACHQFQYLSCDKSPLQILEEMVQMLLTACVTINYINIRSSLCDIIGSQKLEIARYNIRTLLLTIIDYTSTQLQLSTKSDEVDSTKFKDQLRQIIFKFDEPINNQLDNISSNYKLLWLELNMSVNIDCIKCLTIPLVTNGLNQWQYSNNIFRMVMRNVAKMEDNSIKAALINHILDRFSLQILENIDETNCYNLITSFVHNKDLGINFLNSTKKYLNELSRNTTLMIRWLMIVDKMHVMTTATMLGSVELLADSYNRNINMTILMKLDSVLFSRIEVIELSSDDLLQQVLIRIDTLLRQYQWPLIKTIRKIKEIKSQTTIQDNQEDVFQSNINLSTMEKNFWYKCVLKSLQDPLADARLASRLLQGGNTQDIETMFDISLSDSFDSALEASVESKIIDPNLKIDLNNLPLRFIEQSIRLGFLRSGGGGLVQEGVRVDVIFKLGEKLLLNQLNQYLAQWKTGSDEEEKHNQFTSAYGECRLLSLLSALNQYFCLSCQLSVPVPISIDVGMNLLKLLVNLCDVSNMPAASAGEANIIKNRLIVEQLLYLLCRCLSSSFVVMNDEGGMQSLIDTTTAKNTHITDAQILIVCRWLCSLVEADNCGGEQLSVHQCVTLLMNWIGTHNQCSSVLNNRLTQCIVTVARLPGLMSYARNPNHSLEMELSCLSHMNRDELGLCESVFSMLGWTNRYMFEETWLVYLDLLHSNSSPPLDSTDAAPSSQEIVERSHCDSLGLLGLTNLLLKTTLRPESGNPVHSQFEHKPRDKIPNLLHTKVGRKLSNIHSELEEEIFNCLYGTKLLTNKWSFTSWNLEREESILQYRYDQINIDILSKRVTAGNNSSPQVINRAVSPQHIDIVSCLQSLPIICDKWLNTDSQSGTQNFPGLWPRACAIRSVVMLMDLFTSREQINWLLECLLNLTPLHTKLDDDWISTTWICVGLSKCISVAQTTLNPANNLANTPSQLLANSVVPTGAIYGLQTCIKIIEYCIQSDIQTLQQAALYSVMFLLQMNVHGKQTWELPTGSLTELFSLHRMIMHKMEYLLSQIDPGFSTSTVLSASLVQHSDSLTENVANSVFNLSQTVSNKAASLATAMPVLSGSNQLLTNPSAVVNPVSPSGSSNITISISNHNGLPSLVRATTSFATPLRFSERYQLLVMSTACFYCERYPEALQESDLLNNFVTIAKNIICPTDATNAPAVSSKMLLTLCRCLERILLTQRASNIVIEQIIRICSGFLKRNQSSNYSLSVLGLFLTACYMSLTSNTSQPSIINASFESIFHCSPANWNPESQPIILERMNLLWKRLTETELLSSNAECRLLSRMISTIMIEFMSGNDMLNKTIHQLLTKWPNCQFVAKSLFDMITTCLNHPDGEKEIRKWTLMVLPSLVSSTPENLSIWTITIVLVSSASYSRSYLRSTLNQCLDWLTNYHQNKYTMAEELQQMFYLSAMAFLSDIPSNSEDVSLSSSTGTSGEQDQRTTFINCLATKSKQIPVFQRVIQSAHMIGTEFTTQSNQ